MDFFAGSGSTAHGVLRYNAKHNQKCRFVLVQLDESLDFDDKNQKSGYIFCKKNGLPTVIPSLTKERIKRSVDKILEENPSVEMDAGFRVFEIDTSNMRDRFYTAEKTDQANLLDAVENVKSDRTDPEDLLFQVLIDWGVDLTLPIRRLEIDGKTIFFVNEEPYDLIACFDYGVTEELVKELAKHAPARVVFRDNGFASDAVKINVEQIFKQLSPATDVKSI